LEGEWDYLSRFAWKANGIIWAGNGLLFKYLLNRTFVLILIYGKLFGV